MKIIEHKDYRIKVELDSDPLNPRDLNYQYNLGIWLGRKSNRYYFGDKENEDSNIFSNPADIWQLIHKKYDPLIVLPVYCYDHSGLAFSTNPFSCDWDSYICGYIFTNKKKCDLLGVDPTDIENLKKQLIDEIKTYNQYSRGEVYGFTILYPDGAEFESCWGFYDKEGMISECKDMIDKNALLWQQRHIGDGI